MSDSEDSKEDVFGLKKCSISSFVSDSAFTAKHICFPGALGIAQKVVAEISGETELNQQIQDDENPFAVSALGILCFDMTFRVWDTLLVEHK